MSTMKKMLAIGAFAAVAALATQSQAATYLLTQSEAFGDGSFGTVEVTQAGADRLKYVVTLADGFNFTDTGGHYAFSFALQGAPSIDLEPLAGFTLTSSTHNGIKNAPFDGFDYALGCSSACAPNHSGYTGGATPSSLTFYVTGSDPGSALTPSLVDFATKTYDHTQIRFAADVIRTRNCFSDCTGVVGGYELQSTGAVPEPASWAMMILGVFFAGGALRLRRRNALRSVST